jgi:hypothetical protein
MTARRLLAVMSTLKPGWRVRGVTGSMGGRRHRALAATAWRRPRPPKKTQMTLAARHSPHTQRRTHLSPGAQT